MSNGPFFERASRPDQRERRLLLLSYHFPPSASVGARRWEQFARYAADRGWGLDVITCHEGPLDAAGMVRLKQLPEGVRVFGVPQPVLALEGVERALWRAYRRVRPHRSRRPAAPALTTEQTSMGSARVSLERGEMRWPPRSIRDVLRAYQALMVYRRGAAWARAAAALAGRLLNRPIHSAVISSGPPHMSHVGGLLVAQQKGLPMVVDMRDPWSLLPMLHETVASPLWYRLARHYESLVLERAALIIANTDLACAGLAAQYPRQAARMVAVLNGTDDYPLPAPRRSERFTIEFAGTVYLGRDVSTLFHAASCVIRELRLTPREFGLEFIGDFDLPGHLPLRDMASQAGIAEFVTVGGRRAHADALEFLARATMLVVFAGFGPVFIPAKVFEYMRFDAWLLTLAHPDSAVAHLLRDTDADIVPPDDVEGVSAAIRRRFEMHSHGVQPVRIARDDRFSRARQAAILFDAIDRVVDQRDRRRAASTLATES